MSMPSPGERPDGTYRNALANGKRPGDAEPACDANQRKVGFYWDYHIEQEQNRTYRMLPDELEFRIKAA